MNEESAVNLGTILREGLDASPGCFGVLDTEDTVIYCNDTFASVFELSKKEVLGRKNKDLLKQAWETKNGIIIDTDDFEQWYKAIENIQNQKSLNQFETDLTDGRWFKMVRISLENGYILLFGVNITDLKDTQESLTKENTHIKSLVNTDPLTELNNRRAFDQISKHEIEKAKCCQKPLSLLMLDIDHFKEVNDTYGHPAGDHILKEFAYICSKLLRQSDSFYRIGGEEFSILLPNANSKDAFFIAERIRRQIENHSFYLKDKQLTLHITVSIGLSYLIGSDYSIDQVLTRADTALFNAKEGGRNRVIEYSFYSE